ncbi:MAG: AAA family ATPase [Coriobacteriia bacterium]|nr:AAA family ATPase [Coriobacteriia bacterium]
MSLAKFTPSVMSWDTLEKIFVAREKLLERIMGRVEEASKSKKRNHTLIVGPRGSGKTHLVALAYHRTKALIDSGSKLLVSWLPEDPYSIKSYRRLLAAILDRIEGQNNEDKNEAASKNISYHFVNDQEHENALESQLTSLTSVQGPVIVIIENLDQILLSIGRIGQERFRNFLQSSSALLVLATTTRLDRRLANVDSPFFEFFTTTRLEPFTVDEAREFLVRVAELDGDDQLIGELNSAETNTKLHVVAQLAGGQPRLWSVLGSALTVKEIDELVEILLTRFDDLTTYYQERMSRLSDNQQLVVDELARSGNALHVAEIAKRTEISERSVAKTISDLVEYGWLEKVSISWAPLIDKRQSFYELAEPMARLAFQIKDSRGGSLPLIIDFLKNWFTDDELSAFDSLSQTAEHDELAAMSSLVDDEVTPTNEFINRMPAVSSASTELLGQIDDALAGIKKGDSRVFFNLPTPIRSSLASQIDTAIDQYYEINKVRTRIHKQALSEFDLQVKPDGSDDWLRRVEELQDSDDIEYLFLLCQWQILYGHLEIARATLNTLHSLNTLKERCIKVDSLYIEALLLKYRADDNQARDDKLISVLSSIHIQKRYLVVALSEIVLFLYRIRGITDQSGGYYRDLLSIIENYFANDDYGNMSYMHVMLIYLSRKININELILRLISIYNDDADWITQTCAGECFKMLGNISEAQKHYSTALTLVEQKYDKDETIVEFITSKIQGLSKAASSR